VTRSTFAPLLASALWASACGDAPTSPLDPIPDAGPTRDAGAGSSPDAGAGPTPDAGTPPLAEPGHLRGTRLRPMFVGAGQAQRFITAWDTQLDTACWLTRFADADTDVRCYPRASGVLVYGDTRCSTRYVETTATEGWVYADGLVLRLGAPATLAQRFSNLARCGCAPSNQAPQGPVYEIAEELPIEQLAGGRVVDTDESERLRVRTFEGEDGSRFVYDVIDRLASVSCAPAELEGGRCEPAQGKLTDEGRLDESCTRLAILDYGRVGVARVAGRGDAVYRFEFPERGIGNDVVLGRATAAGMCSTERTNLGRYTLHLGTPYPAAEWPALDVVREGTPSLEALVGRLPSGARAEPEPTVEASRVLRVAGTSCVPARTADGLMRCLPTPAEALEAWPVLFADARCGARAARFRAGATPPAEVTILDDSFAALPRGQVYAVDRALPSASVYIESGDGRCRLAAELGLPSTDVYSLSAGAPLQRFPELSLELR